MTETKPPAIPPANLAPTNGSTASGTPTPPQPAPDPAALTLALEDAEQIKRALLESLEQSALADREELLRVTRNVEPSAGTGLMRIGGWLLQPIAAAGSASVSLTYRGPVYGNAAQIYTSTAIRESGFWRVTPVKSGEVRRR